MESERQCWVQRIRYVLFDAVGLLPHPPLLCVGSWGFVVRDYSRSQRQLLRQLITEARWAGLPNMQLCSAKTRYQPQRPDRTSVRSRSWSSSSITGLCIPALHLMAEMLMECLKFPHQSILKVITCRLDLVFIGPTLFPSD